jgi:regulator of sirC expression with transglutaminase-like and TPR domain
MTPLESFTRLVGTDPSGLPLLEAAVHVAQYADPDYSPDDVVRTIRGWGERLRARVAPDASPLNRLRWLNSFFFDELGFGPAADEDRCAADSYLHRAIERRRGLPITLSLIYIELGRAIGLKLAGVGFPGHFLVKLVLADATLVIDVHAQGATLSAEQLQARLDAVLRSTEPHPLHVYLRAGDARSIIARMLRNLRNVHARERDWHAVLEIQNRMIAVLPEAPDERLERAEIYERLECPRAAAEDLEAYLAANPQPRDAGRIRTRLGALRRAAQALN